ncbi:transporter [Nodosilinea nodulosa]|uniref:transporter n=1 Tax=Nodosilinea nodulosa TaxID=416001 RepID=UPI0002D438A2|nr:transporter [Nodosilinea nodulosa]
MPCQAQTGRSSEAAADLTSGGATQPPTAGEETAAEVSEPVRQGAAGEASENAPLPARPGPIDLPSASPERPSASPPSLATDQDSLPRASASLLDLPATVQTTATDLIPLAQSGEAPADPAPGSAPPESPSQTDGDAEPMPQDPELGVIQVRSLLEDNDLGILRIRQQPQLPMQAARPPAKIGFFSARLAIASSDNILLAVNDVGGLTGDTFLRPSIAFGVYPALGPQTALIATADLGLQRYGAQSNLNYDDLRFRVGLRQGLTPRSYGQLIFTYQELYRPGANRARFFKNTALGLTLGRRDPITPKLAFDSYYLVQFNGAQSTNGATTVDFSRLFQSAGGYLGYDITPRVQLGLSYQLNLIDYTAQTRYDTFHQVLGQVVYRLSPNLRLNVYGGFSFGRSSEPRVRFDDTFFGATIDATIPLF